MGSHPSQGSFFPRDAESPHEAPQEKWFAHREQKYHIPAPSLRDCLKFSLGIWNHTEPQEVEQWWMVKSTIPRVRLQLPTQIHCLPWSNIYLLFFPPGLQPLIKSFNQQCPARLQTSNQTLIHAPMYLTSRLQLQRNSKTMLVTNKANGKNLVFTTACNK